MAFRNPLTAKLLNQRVQRHPDGTKEYWRDIIGWKGFYRVSDWGRVKSLARIVIRRNGVPNSVRARIMKVSAAPSLGYVEASLCLRAKYYCYYVHRLVLESFVGPCPEGKQCRHLDNNPENNHLDNLEWGTPEEDGMDRRVNGKTWKGKSIPALRGNKNQVRKLNYAKAQQIRRLSSKGWTNRQLADAFGVSISTIQAIVKGQSWK